MSKTPTRRVNKSYNSLYGDLLNKTEQTVLETIEDSAEPLTPLEIHEKTGINHNSVKFCVRKLARLRLVHRPYYGHYEVMKKPATLEGDRGGVKVFGGLPCVHCLCLVVRLGCSVVRRSEVVADNEFYRVKFVWEPNGTVVVFVECKGGFSFGYGGFRALADFIKAKLGVVDDDKVLVRNFHVNKDFEGIVLKGVQEVTLRSFDGVFKRFYNKAGRTLRVEVPKVGELTLSQAFDALEKGGMSLHGLVQTNFMLIQELRERKEIDRFRNGLFLRLLNGQKRLTDAVFRLLDERDGHKRKDSCARLL